MGTLPKPSRPRLNVHQDSRGSNRFGKQHIPEYRFWLFLWKVKVLFPTNRYAFFKTSVSMSSGNSEI